MISRLRGTLVTRGADRVEIETSGGVVYEVEVPLTVLQRIPSTGSPVELRTLQVVTDSSVALYGFIEAHERALFQRLLTASGVGAKLALAMMSAYDAERLARALVEKDTAALRQVSGVGKKKAEKIALELADRVGDLAIVTPRGDGGARPSAAQEAVQALIALGFTFTEADEAVRGVLEGGDHSGAADELIRKALANR
ncbi:MAG: Holliday junction branch migration protein RuvA [Gemmatimonadota bacterium]|nr:Holliday junction branch migration protein RuvA [Gemmatimonadota bacterium]MDH5759021.1 Holliday junction branch migration protein RuvA [Gemmatimonadota bacterium]